MSSNQIWGLEKKQTLPIWLVYQLRSYLFASHEKTNKIRVMKLGSERLQWRVQKEHALQFGIEASYNSLRISLKNHFLEPYL